MNKTNEKSSDYKSGYNTGYKAGIKSASKKLTEHKEAYWIMRKDGWYCSNCLTKHEQAHDDFCCKCGCKMSEEADYEDY